MTQQAYFGAFIQKNQNQDLEEMLAFLRLLQYYPQQPRCGNKLFGHMEKESDIDTNVEYYSALKRGEPCNMRQHG